jgi:hypothetical protein
MAKMVSSMEAGETSGRPDSDTGQDLQVCTRSSHQKQTIIQRITMNLSDKAMLVRLSISFWQARKYDKQVSNEVKEAYQASGDVGNFNKILVSLEPIKRIQQVVNKARTFHAEQTCVWSIDGVGLLPAANFFNYSKGIRALRGEFDPLVDVFIQMFPSLKADAKRRLPSGLYKEEDYPSTDALRRKFSFETQILPVPTSGDFRVSLAAEEVAEIKAELERQLQESTQEAMKDLWQRLYNSVAHIAERMEGEEKKKFNDTLITNAREIVELLPRLNITGDPALEAMRKEVKDKLCKFEPENLRNSSGLRKKAHTTATDILKKMAGYV